MAINAFLEIEGIPGDSKTKGFEDKIEIIGLEHSITQPCSRSASGRGSLTTGAADVGEYRFFKEIDKASPLLLRHSYNGKHIPKIKLTLRRQAGNNLVNYCEIEFEDAIISHRGVRCGSDGLPQETIGITFSKIKETYKATDTTGNETGSTQAEIDQRTGESA